MTQLDLFTQDPIIPIIPGLTYIPSYISEEEEASLIKIIDQQNWFLGISRRVQHYGYKYDYTTNNIDINQYLGVIPEWLMCFCQRLFDERVFQLFPDQIIINEYIPGQGISSHIDCIPCFEETICSLSLLSPCSMDLSKEEDKTCIYLKPRSLLILSGPARFEWKHGIAARKQDVYVGRKVARTRRVSITFRKVKSIDNFLSN